jgi:hypothetical protein
MPNRFHGLVCNFRRWRRTTQLHNSKILRGGTAKQAEPRDEGDDELVRVFFFFCFCFPLLDVPCVFVVCVMLFILRELFYLDWYVLEF